MRLVADRCGDCSLAQLLGPHRPVAVPSGRGTPRCCSQPCCSRGGTPGGRRCHPVGCPGVDGAPAAQEQVSRGLGEQLLDRRRGPGPVVRRGEVSQSSVAVLREVALPHLRRLVEEVEEAPNVMVLSGASVRFVATVKSAQSLR